MTYSVHIIQPGEGEDPNRNPTAQEFLSAYASTLFFFK